MFSSNVLKTAAQRDSIKHILLLRCWTKIENKAGNCRAVCFFLFFFKWTRSNFVWRNCWIEVPGKRSCCLIPLISLTAVILLCYFCPLSFLFFFFSLLINASCQALQLQSARWMKNFSTDSKNTSLSIRGPGSLWLPGAVCRKRCHSSLNTVNWHRVTTNSQ